MHEVVHLPAIPSYVINQLINRLRLLRTPAA